MVALVTKARNGTVSIIRDLMPEEAESLRRKLMYLDGPPPDASVTLDDEGRVIGWVRSNLEGDIVECHIV